MAIGIEQQGSQWNNLKAHLYINLGSDDFQNAELFDSTMVTDGWLEFSAIVPAHS